MSAAARLAGWLALVGLLWLGSSGLVSSNDGSHWALARALVLRGTTTIDEDVALTLWVDRAARDGHQYSDRPPGTALLAMPAARLGAALDPWLLRRSVQTHAVIVTPAAPAYAHVYTTRPVRLGVTPTPLLAYQGTALAMSLHAALVGALGLMATAAWLRRCGVAWPGRVIAVGCLAFATLWGPYSTMLFSHVTTGTMLAAMLWALHVVRTEDRRWAAAAVGLAAGWAVASDYLAGLLAVGLVVATSVDLRADLRRAPWAIAGAIPIVAVTLAYHDAAFGSPWSIGYDHHANFGFARDRGETFSGDPLAGLWAQWGLGSGMLGVAPLGLVGVAGLLAVGQHRLLVGALPWIAALALHRTPAGGGSEDHRYLVPLLPVLGLGLGLVWQRHVAAGSRARAVALAIVAVAAVSAVLSWSHVLAVRG